MAGATQARHGKQSETKQITNDGGPHSLLVGNNCRRLDCDLCGRRLLFQLGARHADSQDRCFHRRGRGVVDRAHLPSRCALAVWREPIQTPRGRAQAAFLSLCALARHPPYIESYIFGHSYGG